MLGTWKSSVIGFLLYSPKDFSWMLCGADGDVTVCFPYMLELGIRNSDVWLSISILLLLTDYSGIMG